LNLHQYAPNPVGWIDPWGWSRECGAGTTPNKKTSYDGVSRRDALRQAKRDAGIPNSQQPIKISRDQLDDGRGNTILIQRDSLLQRESITTPLKTENQLLFKSTALGIQKPQRVTVLSHILMCGR
jgi:hypothetical protein